MSGIETVRRQDSDESFEQQVDLDFDLICDICASLQDSVPEISSETAERIIKSLKNNRSCDGNGRV